MSKFKDAQQKIIDCEMRNMEPAQINEILADMKPAEADRFLGRLGHVRAKDIYDKASEAEHGNKD